MQRQKKKSYSSNPIENEYLSFVKTVYDEDILDGNLNKERVILHGYIVPGYEVLHTQSREYIVDALLDVMKEGGVEI